MRRSHLVLIACLMLLPGCFLKERSVLHSVHPKAEVLLENATEGRFSPDGRTLAFVRVQGGKAWTADIYVKDLESGKERRITSNSDYDGQPCWAPDSKLLVYTSRRGGLFNLYLTSVADGGERQITWAGARQPDFSPDGASIVFTGEELGGLDLYVTSPGGGIVKRLTEEPGREWFPRYSPDGRYIAYVSDQAGSDDLWLLERSSGRKVRLTELPGEEVMPSWSPDSRVVVYSSGGQAGASDGHSLDLYAIEVPEGPVAGRSVALTRCEGLVCQSTLPSFSPDGDRLVFTSEFNPLQPRLALISVGQTLVATLREGK